MRALAHYKIIIDNEKSFITKYHFKNRLMILLITVLRMRFCSMNIDVFAWHAKIRENYKNYKSIKLTLSIFWKYYEAKL